MSRRSGIQLPNAPSPPGGEEDDEPIVVSDGESFAEARTRREVAAADKEEYNRDIAKIDRDERRGTLVTKKESEAAAAAVRDAFLAVGKQLWTRVDTTLSEDVNASDRRMFAQALDSAWMALLGEMSA